MMRFEFRKFTHEDQRNVLSAYRVFDGKRCLGSVVRLRLGGWRARDPQGHHVADWHTRAEAVEALYEHRFNNQERGNDNAGHGPMPEVP